MVIEKVRSQSIGTHFLCIKTMGYACGLKVSLYGIANIILYLMENYENKQYYEIYFDSTNFFAGICIKFIEI